MPYAQAGKVVGVACAIASLLFISIGIFGYLAFRSGTYGDILANFDGDIGIMTRLGFCCTMLSR